MPGAASVAVDWAGRLRRADSHQTAAATPSPRPTATPAATARRCQCQRGAGAAAGGVGARSAGVVAMGGRRSLRWPVRPLHSHDGAADVSGGNEKGGGFPWWHRQRGRRARPHRLVHRPRRKRVARWRRLAMDLVISPGGMAAPAPGSLALSDGVASRLLASIDAELGEASAGAGAGDREMSVSPTPSAPAEMGGTPPRGLPATSSGSSVEWGHHASVIGGAGDAAAHSLSLKPGDGAALAATAIGGGTTAAMPTAMRSAGTATAAAAPASALKAVRVRFLPVSLLHVWWGVPQPGIGGSAGGSAASGAAGGGGGSGGRLSLGGGASAAGGAVHGGSAPSLFLRPSMLSRYMLLIDADGPLTVVPTQVLTTAIKRTGVLLGALQDNIVVRGAYMRVCVCVCGCACDCGGAWAVQHRCGRRHCACHAAACGRQPLDRAVCACYRRCSCLQLPAFVCVGRPRLVASRGCRALPLHLTPGPRSTPRPPQPPVTR